MRITYTPPVKPSDKSGKKRSASSASGAFEGLLGGASGADGTGATQDVSEVNSFLFLQEVSDEEIARQKAIYQGKSAIAALEQLHRDLLMGIVPEATLQRLENVVARQREAFNDPRLQSILDDIELRAAVELAKLERAKTR